MKGYDTLAAVDLGSNSFRLEVVRVAGDQLYPLDSLKETVRLAAGLSDSRQIDEITQTRALDCLQRFGERLSGLAPEAVRCVGTSTLRVAKRADDFVRKAEAALGHPIEIVAGREEARLIYLGVAHSLPQSDDRRLVIDIGGGSTEVIIGQGLEPIECESINMGCVIFSKRFFEDGVLDKTTLKAAEVGARVKIERLVQSFAREHWQQAIGSSGTARALREILEQNGWSKRGITAEGLGKLRNHMIKAGHVDALELEGLRSDRRPVIAGGFAIMAGLFAELDIEHMDVAETAMREGILYDLLGRFHQQDMREVTVAEFMRRYHVDSEQAERVRQLALKLLEAAGLGDAAGTIFVEWAARLHEIGLSVSHSGYQRHSGYILENADMPGFSRTDQLRLALLARAQRGVLAKLPEFDPDGGVSERERLMVWVLRQAVLLSRSRTDSGIDVLKVDVDGRRIRLKLPEGWLQCRPLTQRALEEESVHWHAAGTKFLFA